MEKFSALEMAVQVYNSNNYISIEDAFLSTPSELTDPLNPQTVLLIEEHERIKQNAWKNLSEEAKQVLEVLFDCPSELIGTITTPKGKICYKKILKHLRKLWGEKSLVDKIDRELTKFAKICCEK